MPSSSETGHGVNLANAKKLSDFCSSLNAVYKPSNGRFKLAAFGVQLVECASLFNKSDAAARAAQAAENDRSTAFEGLSALSTRIMKSYRSSGASKKSVADVEAVHKKIQGTRATRADSTPAADGTTTRKNSVSQKSFDMMLVHFRRLIDSLDATPEYAPAEEELTTTILKQRLTTMERSNATYGPLQQAAREALLARDLAFYGEETGLVDTALGIKEYISSLDKKKNPGIAGVSAFKFRNVRSNLKKAGMA